VKVEVASQEEKVAIEDFDVEKKRKRRELQEDEDRLNYS